MCIVDTKIDIFITNPRLRLASNNINPDIFNFLFECIN